VVWLPLTLQGLFNGLNFQEYEEELKNPDYAESNSGLITPPSPIYIKSTGGFSHERATSVRS
jgi:hypothetical protein